MIRSNMSRSAPIAITMAVLMLLLPMTATAAPSDERAEQLLDAVRYVEFQTRSAEPEAVRYLRDDASSSGMWDLERRLADKSATDAGSFRPVKSFSLAGTTSAEAMAALDEKGVTRFDREIVVGTVYGPDGGEQLVAAVRFDIAVRDGERTVSESAIVPILHGTDLEKLQVVAGELAERAASRAIPGYLPTKDFSAPPAKSTCHHYCMQEFETDIFICKATATACITAITAAGLTCINACPLTGPGVIPCLILCGVGDLAGVALCLLNEWSCRRAAGRQRTSCIAACPPPEI